MVKILLLMILCHIIDDFVLQPICLSKLKQETWWKENAPDEKYKDDYLMALLIHAMSWSIMILLPIMFFKPEIEGLKLICIFLINTCTHAYIDDVKANDKKINLIIDQLIHFIQIIITFILLVIF